MPRPAPPETDAHPWWVRVVDVFVPEAIRTGPPEQLRRARLTVTGCVAFSAAQLISTSTLYDFDPTGVVDLLAGAMTFALAIALRRGAPLPWVVHGFVGVLLGFSLVEGGLSGGEATSSLYMASIVPAAAIMLRSRLAGAAWAALGLVVLGGLSWLGMTGYEFPVHVPEAIRPVSHFGGAALLMMSSSAFALCYDWLTQRALYDVAAAQRESAVARASAYGSESRYRQLFDHSPFGVLSLDPEGRLVAANPRAMSLLGVSGNPARVGDVLALPRVRDSELGASLGRWLATGDGGGSKAMLSSDGDTHVDLQVLITPLTDPHGAAESALVLLEDVTEERRREREARELQENMRETQRLESLGVLAGGVAHDFNNLLTTILGNASMLVQSAPERDRELAQEIAVAAQQASELTRQMLDYAGRGERASGTVDLSEAVDDIRSLLGAAVGPDVELRTELDRGLPTIDGDAGQLRQIALNLVTNASEALDGHGCVTVRTRSARLGPEDLRDALLGEACPAGTYVVLEVEDDGCGMDDDLRTRIFEPFYTTKSVGRGLGLSALLGIVRRHSGAVRVETRRGEGTVFQIFLSAQESGDDAHAIHDLEIGSWSSNATVLIVDDEERVRRVAARALHRCGISVLEAGSGDEALAIYDSRSAEVDAVLLDLTMPGMRGEAVLERLHERRADLPVVLTSGYGPGLSSNSAAAGWLAKPFSVGKLQSVMRDVLEANV